MSEWLKNLWADLQIVYSNYNAGYSWIVRLLLILLVAGLLFWALLRALRAGRQRCRCSSPLKSHRPDDALTARAAESLAQAVAVPTVTGDREAISRLDDYLESRYPLVNSRLNCARMPDGSLLIRWRSGGETEKLPVLLCGHLDVVPPGSGWTMEPFAGERRDGDIFGRGSVDCKATVISLLEAAENLLQQGFRPERDIYFAFGADEETGGTAGAAAIAQLLGRRGLRFDLVLDEGGYIAENHLDRPEHAAALILVGEKRSCNFRLTATTNGGHSSTPGHPTALGALSEAICRIESAQPHHHVLPVVRDYLNASLPAMSFGKRFAVCNMPISQPILARVFRDDPRMSALMRSTVAPTQMEGAPAPNILPVRAEAVANARLLPGDTPGELLRHLRALLADLPIRVELETDGGESPLSSASHPMFHLWSSTLHGMFPRLPCLATLMTGATDSRHYANLADCVLRFTPLVRTARENAGVHGADECLSELSLGLAVELYMDFIRKL